MSKPEQSAAPTCPTCGSCSRGQRFCEMKHSGEENILLLTHTPQLGERCRVCENPWHAGVAGEAAPPDDNLMKLYPNLKPETVKAIRERQPMALHAEDDLPGGSAAASDAPSAVPAIPYELVGNLLDHWERVANDTRTDIRDLETGFYNALERLEAWFAADHQAQPPAGAGSGDALVEEKLNWLLHELRRNVGCAEWDMEECANLLRRFVKAEAYAADLKEKLDAANKANYYDAQEYWHGQYIKQAQDAEALAAENQRLRQALAEFIRDVECYCADNPTGVCPIHKAKILLGVK